MHDALTAVLNAVAATTGRDLAALSGDTAIDSLKLDSLDEVEILMSLEEKLGVVAEQSQVNACRTLGDLALLMQKALDAA